MGLRRLFFIFMFPQRSRNVISRILGANYCHLKGFLISEVRVFDCWGPPGLCENHRICYYGRHEDDDDDGGT